LTRTFFKEVHVNEPRPTFAACPDCGEALHRDELEGHHCDRARQFEAALRREVRAFEGQFGAWLGTPQGRFAAWLAERERR
jgi:ssDNA-binding Zn-finger/Zn-ribbon topoisomerase 1